MRLIYEHHLSFFHSVNFRRFEECRDYERPFIKIFPICAISLKIIGYVGFEKCFCRSAGIEKMLRTGEGEWEMVAYQFWSRPISDGVLRSSNTPFFSYAVLVDSKFLVCGLCIFITTALPRLSFQAILVKTTTIRGSPHFLCDLPGWCFHPSFTSVQTYFC